jgi:pSer/pThr/pTyr-binding forkhead associated (FHA) protein
MAGCPKCGYPLRASDQRCPNCDQPVEANEAHFQPTLNGTVMAGMGTGERQKEGKRLEAFLVTYSPNPLGDFFPVFEGRNYVGRDHLSNICVEGDSLISGKHFSILYRPVDKKFKFRDEQSSNGTFVNDQLADEGELQHGDVIRIGSTRLLFMIIPTF